MSWAAYVQHNDGIRRGTRMPATASECMTSVMPPNVRKTNELRANAGNRQTRGWLALGVLPSLPFFCDMTVLISMHLSQMAYCSCAMLAGASACAVFCILFLTVASDSHQVWLSNFFSSCVTHVRTWTNPGRSPTHHQLVYGVPFRDRYSL